MSTCRGGPPEDLATIRCACSKKCSGLGRVNICELFFGRVFNYREALFLGYGAATETLLSGYVDDLGTVLAGFVSMAGAFASKRLGNPLWDDFVADVDARRAFSIGPRQVWS